MEQLGDAIAARDPQADLRLALICPACEHGWSAPLDVSDIVWRELEERARQLVSEIAALAGAFGWDEREILRLTPARRRLYLDAVGL